MRKGVSPGKIIANLQEDFLAHGLEAYDQFKRLNVGIDHDEAGEAQKRVAEDGKEVIEPLEDAETKAARAAVYGVFRLPGWLGDRTDKEGRGSLVDTSESAAYIERKKRESLQKADGREPGPTMVTLMNHVHTNEPAPHTESNEPGGGGGPGGGDGGNEGGETDIKTALRRARDPDGEDDYF